MLAVNIIQDFFSNNRKAVEVFGDTPALIINPLVTNSIILAGIIFFIWIIIAGWGVITSAGEESSAQDKAKAKAAITYAVIGFLLVVTAYFILQIVGVITGINFINPAI